MPVVQSMSYRLSRKHWPDSRVSTLKAEDKTGKKAEPLGEPLGTALLDNHEHKATSHHFCCSQPATWCAAFLPSCLGMGRRKDRNRQTDLRESKNNVERRCSTYSDWDWKWLGKHGDIREDLGTAMVLGNLGNGRKQGPLAQLFRNNLSVLSSMLCCGYISLTSGLSSSQGLKHCLQTLIWRNNFQASFLSQVVSLKVKLTLVLIQM